MLGGQGVEAKGLVFLSPPELVVVVDAASPFSGTMAVNPYLYETPSDIAAYSGFFCSVKCSVAPGRLLSISLSPPSVDPACLPPRFLV